MATTLAASTDTDDPRRTRPVDSARIAPTCGRVVARSLTGAGDTRGHVVARHPPRGATSSARPARLRDSGAGVTGRVVRGQRHVARYGRLLQRRLQRVD